MNRLTLKNIAHYLLSRGFLDPDRLIAGEYKVNVSQSRNSNFRITTGEPQGLFVKQLVNGDSQNSYLIQKDATVHYLLHHHEAFRETAKHVAKYYGYDPKQQVLTIGYFVDAENIYELFYNFEGHRIPEKLIAQMANIMASFHRVPLAAVEDSSSGRFFYQQLPWIFNWDLSHGNSPHHYATYLNAQKEIIDSILAARNLWEKKALIHGDIKWVNFIQERESKDLKLIDWEIADFGDPVWDVAGMFQSFLCHWALTFDDTTMEHRQQAHMKSYTMDKAKSGIRTFWEAYKREMKISDAEEDALLLKVIRFTGVRMIQTAFELSEMQKSLKPNAVRITQMAAKMLTETEAQLNQLFQKETA